MSELYINPGIELRNSQREIHHFRTRLAKVTYKDSAGTKSSPDVTTWAFFIEDDAEMARQNKLKVLTQEGALFEDLDLDSIDAVDLVGDLVQPGAPVAFPLQQQETHERLRARQEHAPAIERVLVVERRLGQRRDVNRCVHRPVSSARTSRISPRAA